jgi:hypothetical protein
MDHGDVHNHPRRQKLDHLHGARQAIHIRSEVAALKIVHDAKELLHEPSKRKPPPAASEGGRHCGTI